MSKFNKKLNRVSETSPVGSTDTKASMNKSVGEAISRRSFLRNSSLMAGGAVLTTAVAPTMMKKAEAATPSGTTGGERIRTICTHCSVGCGIIAEVQNGAYQDVQ